jgi:hypothetical protein
MIFDVTAGPLTSDGYGILPTWQSGERSNVGTATTWYDSPLLNQTLLANHTYSLGVVASQNFTWYIATSGSDTGAGQLTVPFQTAFADVVDPTTLTLSVRDAYAIDPLSQPSLRVFGSAGAPTPPVPEPAEWTMLLAGLLVVAFVANRQRGHRI